MAILDIDVDLKGITSGEKENGHRVIVTVKLFGIIIKRQEQSFMECLFG